MHTPRRLCPQVSNPSVGGASTSTALAGKLASSAPTGAAAAKAAAAAARHHPTGPTLGEARAKAASLEQKEPPSKPSPPAKVGLLSTGFGPRSSVFIWQGCIAYTGSD